MGIKVVVAAVAGSAGQGKCTKRLAQTARKNAKSLSNREMTVPYIARTVFRSARTKDAKETR